MKRFNRLLHRPSTLCFNGAGAWHFWDIDYRSNNGLYIYHKNVEYYLSHSCLTQEPDVFYDYVKTNLYKPDALPNVIHQKQVALTQQDRKRSWFQNITICIIAGATPSRISRQPVSGLLPKMSSASGLAHLFEVTSSWKLWRPPGWCGSLWRRALRPILRMRLTQWSADLIVITDHAGISICGLLDYRNPAAPVTLLHEPLSFSFNFAMVQEDAAQFFQQLKV